MTDRVAAEAVLGGISFAFDAVWGTAFAIAEASPGGRLSRPALEALVYATHNVPLGVAKGGVTQDWGGVAVDLATGVIIGTAASAAAPVLLTAMGVAATPLAVGVAGAALAWGMSEAVSTAWDWANSPEGQTAFDTVEEAFMDKLTGAMETLSDGAGDLSDFMEAALHEAMAGVDGLASNAEAAASDFAEAAGEAIGQLADHWADALAAADGAIDDLGQALLDGLEAAKAAADERWSEIGELADDLASALGAGAAAVGAAVAALGAAGGPQGPLGALAAALDGAAATAGALLNALLGPNGPLGPFGPQAGDALPGSDLSKAFEFPPISPLVLDLDGDGVDLIDLDDSTAHFDLNQNGLAELTAWIGPSDAFLALDANSDGVINNLSELFGGQEVDGFTKLSVHDLNSDDTIDSSDAVYANLLLWRDLDGDGVTDAGELEALSAAGITSIALNASFIDEWVSGSWISHQSTYAGPSDGGAIFDVWFENDQSSTVNNSIGSASVAAGVQNLPFLPGYGSVPDLYTALTADAGLLNDLQDLVFDADTLSASALQAAIEGFLIKWAEVDGVSTTGRGAYINGRHLAFLEQLHGTAFVAFGGGANPGLNAAAALEEYYDTIIASFTADLISQFAASNLMLTRDIDAVEGYSLNRFAGLSSNTSPEAGLADIFPRLVEVAEGIKQDFGFDSDAGPNQADLAEGVRQIALLKLVTQAYERDAEALNSVMTDVITDAGFDSGWRLTLSRLEDVSPLWGTSGANTLTATGTITTPLFGADGDDALNGTARADILAGGRGDDTLAGLGGDDTYIFRTGDGADLLKEAQASGSDRLILGVGLTASNVVVTRLATDARDVRLSFGPADSVTIDDQFRDPAYYGVEKIQFGDGVVWSREDLRDAYVAQAQTPGNDTIHGFTGANIYRILTLAGQDTLVEAQDGADLDKLMFGAGLDPSNLIITRSTTDLDDVRLAFGGSGSFTLDEQFQDPAYHMGVEQIQFGNGVVWTDEDLRRAYVAQAQTAGHDTINGFRGDNTFLFAALAGNDVLVEAQDSSSVDRLVLGTGLNPSGLLVTRSTTDLDDVKLSFGSSGSLTLDEQFQDSTYRYGVEQIEFGDGTLWTAGDLRRAYVAQAQTLGNDTLNGFRGNDTFLFSALAGNDILIETQDSSSVDRLVLGVGLNPANLVITRSMTDRDDVKLSFGGSGSLTLDEQFQDPTYRYGVEQIEFGDGTLWTAGDLRRAYVAQAQTAGNDTIHGFQDGDTFAFLTMSGNDVLIEAQDSGSVDRLVLGAGLNPADLIITRSTTDLDDVKLSFGGSGSLTLDEQFQDPTYRYGVEQIEFGDGTLWTAGDLRRVYVAQAQTVGNDTIYGFQDGDTFAFLTMSGNDVLIEAQDSGSVDRLVLGAGLNPADLIITRSTTDLDDVKLSFGGSGSLTLDEQFQDSTYRYGVEQIEFGDGTLWTAVNLRAAYLTAAQTSGSDVVVGFTTADSLSGDAGDDTINGLGGTDTLYGGEGADALTGGSGGDRFVYAAAADSPAGGGWDRIADFLQGTDLIDLSAVDANSVMSGDQAFTWLGNAAFSNQPGQLRYQQFVTGTQTVLGDLDGDGLADFRIDLTGAFTPSAGAFLF